ncbi:MAG: UDP-N-acetylglucosamine 2-epimerase (non-hydrolyzing) [Deltaproteobacteria bacterium]|nr:UDP-N-acetylglucosamine 2-epimerase (non-hydrolyzing) [Deltaproteobacteria bacterium]
MTPIVFVAGARPNFMKVAPLMAAMEARRDAGPALLVHTGQHSDYAMSEVFFEDLGIREPDAHLQIGFGSHGVQAGRTMAAFEELLQAMPARPRGIVVVGDVNSTMACALVGVKLGIPVAHVEAGLRSFDRTMPEEINRVVTDVVADLLLVSDPAGLDNLAHEGVPPERVSYVGNVMIDTLVRQLPHARTLDMPDRLGLRAGEYALVTLHRPSNVDVPEQLQALLGFLRRLAGSLPTVFPMHPRTAKRLDELGLRSRIEGVANLHLCGPLGYRETLGLQSGARVVATDSGGIQEETTFLGIPCVTLRKNTERPVTVSHGTNVVVGEDMEAAWRAVTEILAGRGKSAASSIDGWDGHAAERVVSVLLGAWGRQ